MSSSIDLLKDDDKTMDEIGVKKASTLYVVYKLGPPKEKKFPEADKIRNKLALDGIILEDSPSGTKWRINN